MKQTLNFETLFRALPAQYVVLENRGPGYKMVAASDEYLAVTGKTKAEVIGKNLFDVFPDLSERAKKTGKGELAQSFERTAATKQPDSTGVIRYDIQNSNGETVVRYWQATHYPLISGGECTHIVQSTADVTEMVHSGEKLRLAELQLDDALSAGLIGSWTWDVPANIVKADKGLARLFGVSIEEALSGLPLDTFVAAIHGDDRARVGAEINAVLKSGETFESEYRTVNADGDVHWVIARGRVERNAQGTPLRFPGVMIDISTRKHVEQELKDSEERLRFLADSMPQLVWITRPDGYHEYYNKQWYEYTGTNSGQTDGEGWSNLFHPDDQMRAWSVWEKSLKTGEPYEIKYRLYHAPSESYRWVIGRALPFLDARGKILKWYGTCTDIDDSIRELEDRKRLEAELSEEKARLEERVHERTSQLRLTNEGLREEIKKRRKAETKLKQNSTELKRSNEELENFAYVSSHDLQEPLRKIQSFGDVLREEYAEKLDDGALYIERMQSAASRMSTLIEDLLTFSRVSTKPAEPALIDLNETLRSVTSDLEARIESESGTLTIVDNLPTITADATHMRQLFQNLISNGLKFHREGVSPVVSISVQSSSTQTCIRVADNGIGIDKKYHEKVFAVFQRLGGRQKFEGTGIGLAVCKKIVERYNGTITIESSKPHGTTFVICLPVQKGKKQ